MGCEPFSREEQLVVQCARAAVLDEGIRSDLFDRELDWETVVALSNAHSITPLVSEALRDHDPGVVPEAVLEALDTRSKRVARRNLRMLQEVSSLCTAFRREGIRAIPYRGPVVAQVVYGDVGLREFGDLDFLVSQRSIPAIRSLLFDRGYQQRYVLDSTERLTDRQEWAYVRFSRDHSFVHPSESFEVELHWRIIDTYFPTEIGLETVWDRRSTLSVAGSDVPIFAPEDRLLACCIHGTRHRWERLHWVCDVAASLRSHSFDWDAIVRRAQKHHCERMVYLGLAIANDLLEAPLPRRVRELIDADPAIEPLRAHVYQRLFDDASYWYWDLRRYQSKTLERYQDKAAFWIKGMLEPGGGDVELVSLPRSLAPLYAVARWVRVGRQAANQLVGDRSTSLNRTEDRSVSE